MIRTTKIIGYIALLVVCAWVWHRLPDSIFIILGGLVMAVFAVIISAIIGGGVGDLEFLKNGAYPFNIPIQVLPGNESLGAILARSFFYVIAGHVAIFVLLVLAEASDESGWVIGHDSMWEVWLRALSFTLLCSFSFYAGIFNRFANARTGKIFVVFAITLMALLWFTSVFNIYGAIFILVSIATIRRYGRKYSSEGGRS